VRVLRERSLRKAKGRLMLPGEVRGDAAFTAFQEKLATVVVGARARGFTISGRFERDCKCPLGAHPDSTHHHPPSVTANRECWPEVPVPHLSAFIRGYARDDVALDGNPYYELGLVYREQFP
jgi:hypothetical protein